MNKPRIDKETDRKDNVDLKTKNKLEQTQKIIDQINNIKNNREIKGKDKIHKTKTDKIKLKTFNVSSYGYH